MNFYELEDEIKSLSKSLSKEQKEKDITIDLSNISTDYFLEGYYPILEDIEFNFQNVVIDTKEYFEK